MFFIEITTELGLYDKYRLALLACCIIGLLNHLMS